MLNAEVLGWARQEAGKVAARSGEVIPFHPDCIQPAPLMPTLQPFTVRIGSRTNPRLSFEVMALSAASAQEQHEDLAELGERVEVAPKAYGSRCHLCGTPRENMRSTWCSWCHGGKSGGSAA